MVKDKMAAMGLVHNQWDARFMADISQACAYRQQCLPDMYIQCLIVDLVLHTALQYSADGP